MAAENGGVPEAEVIQTGSLDASIATDIFGLNGLARKTSYPVNQSVGFLKIFCEYYGKNQFFCMKIFNNSSI